MARPIKSVCEKHKIPRVFYPRVRNGILGRESYCKECDKAKRLKYKYKEGEYRRRWRKKPNSKAIIRNSFLLRTYGISLDDFNIKLKKQNHRCAICARHESEFKTGLHVDHIHGSKTVRGLLCGDCNKACGLFQENPEITLKAASYIALKGS